jgi:hypothetical protein
MKKKIVLAIIAIAIIAFIIVKVIPRETDRVKKDVMALKQAVEQENVIAAHKYIDSTYTDNHSLTYHDLTNAVSELFSQFDACQVSMSGLKICIDSTDQKGTKWASCSLGLKIFARYGDDKVLVYGGIVKPSPVKAWLRKSTTHYKVISAEY